MDKERIFFSQEYSERVERNRVCDIARGIGIILVVWGHLKSCPVHDEIYLFHMPLFFLLSGFFLNINKAVKVLFTEKMRFLIGPFFLFYIAAFICGIIRDGYYNPIDYIRSLNGHIMAPNAPLWFLLSLFEVSLLAYSIEKFVAQKYIKLLIVFSFTLLGYYLAMKGIRIPGGISQTFLCYIFFQIGYWSRCYKWKWYLSGYFIPLVILGYSLGIILHVKTDINLLMINYTYFLFLIPALCGSLIVIYISFLCQNCKYAGWLAYLGQNSLLIMCTHVPLILTFNISLSENGLFSDLISLLVLLSISLCIGLLFKNCFPYFFRKIQLLKSK